MDIDAVAGEDEVDEDFDEGDAEEEDENDENDDARGGKVKCCRGGESRAIPAWWC